MKFSALVERIKATPGPLYDVFDKIDRFSRDLYQDEVKVLQQLVRQGRIELHFPYDALYINQHSSAADWFRLGIGLALAQYSSNAISDNVKRKFGQILSEGHWPHQAPLGYRNRRIDEKRTSIVRDEDRAPHIVQAFELRAVGIPFETIAIRLYKAGFRSRAGKRITKGMIEKILRNPFYAGTMLHNGELYPHDYPILISKDLYEQCQIVKHDRKHDATKYNSKAFILKAIPKCGRCGRAVSSYRGRGNVYLRCAATGAQSCGNPNTNQDLVLNVITDDLDRITASVTTWMEEARAELLKRHEEQQHYFKGNTKRLRIEYDGLSEKINKVYMDYQNGRIPVARHDVIVKDLEKQQQQTINDQIKDLTTGNVDYLTTAS